MEREGDSLTLPCHPRIATCYFLQATMNQLGLGTDVAAFWEERDPLSSGFRRLI